MGLRLFFGAVFGFGVFFARLFRLSTFFGGFVLGRLFFWLWLRSGFLDSEDRLVVFDLELDLVTLALDIFGKNTVAKSREAIVIKGKGLRTLAVFLTGLTGPFGQEILLMIKERETE